MSLGATRLTGAIDDVMCTHKETSQTYIDIDCDRMRL